MLDLRSLTSTERAILLKAISRFCETNEEKQYQAEVEKLFEKVRDAVVKAT